MNLIPPAGGGVDEEQFGAPPAAALSAADDEAQEFFHVTSFREAARVLEDNAGRPICHLCVRKSMIQEWEQDEGNGPHSFRQFVTMLAQSDLRGVHLPSWNVLRVAESDVARLFGDVLPGHPTLESIKLDCGLPAAHMRLFTAAMGTMSRRRGGVPLERLSFVGEGFTRELAHQIADMLHRNVPIGMLEVCPFPGGADPGSGKLLFEAVPHAMSLRYLRIILMECSADALDGAAASPALKSLWVDSETPFPDEAVRSLSKQLRTNTTLTDLFLGLARYRLPREGDPELFRPLAHVLDTYNFTLERVSVGPAYAGSAAVRTIDDLLRRNGRIRTALDHWQPRDYHVSPASLWPVALAMVRRLPTLLYRFVRKGDLNLLGDHFAPRGGGSVLVRKKRGRGN
jgi:hypothetical protein